MTTDKNKGTGKPEPVKIQVAETAKATRERRIKELKGLDPAKTDQAVLYEFLVKTNERLEEIYDLIKNAQ